MFGETSAFSGFSVDDLDAARRFYGETLGLKVEEQGEGEMRMLFLTLAGGTRIFVYPKENHTPASYTILNFEVDDIERAVDDLAARGVTLERYPDFEADEKGIVRDEDGGLSIAWFTDPAGNVLSVLHGHP
ncbi:MULTISPECIES: VOC family protein [Streptomyces]|uniref:Glyoxalase n=1 Tax=Streptomyces venezuelae TaxID=54571 RepID=A0A5P2APQ0_STRVZ|nr:VOC family protein [Streptomyces venezuelae]QES18269.1 glyoxalase [Streptomyces venezuelae]